MHKRHRCGFMLIELLGAVAILAILVLAIGAYKVAAAGHMKQAYLRYQAINLAASQIEDLKQIARNDFNDSRLSAAEENHTPSITVPADFTMTYHVYDRYDWPEDGTESTDPVDSDIDYKSVSVEVNYRNIKTGVLRPHNSLPLIRLTTYIANR